ncbi:c-type cytochrome domain-containing protein [Sphingobacterium sp. HJSM2_6]|uniref:c-type cytochrome domain-containing protein n=1 Tax=Sphingobacterium sp. HJSM2_6 TaxID=3366264 RepID=UPI003BCE3FF1
MTLKNLHFNILLGLNSFIVFFLLFEESIQIPVYLQVIGRMHPLLLHFPIVLFIITWILFIFRQRLEKDIPRIKAYLNFLLFFSSLLIAITVIMGLLLSKEGGFEGNSYDWHKYTGIALSILSMSLLGYLRFANPKAYHPVFTVSIHITMIMLLLVGHFGAALTHGEDFITGPLMRTQSNELDAASAMVFEDAVLPILQAKCMSCHNSSKAKGNLILSDSSSMLKGGKNGKLFTAGDPIKSLMIERLLLDIENQHRMPPKGKPQLSIDEISLLKAWIKSGGKFDEPLAAFNEQDSLYQSVKAVYGFEGAETFTFAAADEDDIKKLITPYRIIKTLDAGSPALDVNFYGKDFYNTQSLIDLLPLAEQVVSLNLSAMPIHMEDIQTLKKFVNLRNLKLNNTKLSNEAVLLLTELKNLKNISLIGTEINKDGLEQLAGMSSIRKVFVWNTQVKLEELAAIKKKFPSLRIDAGKKLDESQKLALTPVKISPERSFFQKEIMVSLTHPVPGVKFHYTIDGSDPDSVAALVYQSPFAIQKDVVLRVKAKKEGWLPSNEVRQNFYATFITPQKVTLESKPNAQYKARKEKSFFDLESGGVNNADGRWLGFQGNDLSASLYFETAVHVDTLSLSIKQEYGQHIYPPEFLEVWGGTDTLNLKLLNKVRLDMDKTESMRNRRIIACHLPNQSVRVLRLKTKHYAKIPDGFPAAGSIPWLFVDEIILK